MYRCALAALTVLGLMGSIATPVPPLGAQAEGRLYPPTGHTLAGQFVAFFDAHGGVPQFGYPVTEARMEGGYLVQWTERQRLEYHPENRGTEYEVLLGLLGRELTKGLEGPRFANCQLPIADCGLGSGGAQAQGGGGQNALMGTRFFEETGQTVSEPFLSYWEGHGGLRIFGYPISTLYTDGNGLQVQWFERARLEYHPEYGEGTVLLGLLGTEAGRAREMTPYEVEISGTPARDNAPEIDLAQGGESADPGFLENVRGAGAALGPGLVRLDNIFNFYNIARRDATGAIVYRWDLFDRAIDSVRAMGKDPLICLSYMPETMSVSSASRVEPPRDYAEWAGLVTATVRHVNVERNLHVRYWEVWNEPDQDGFWRAPFEDYLRLYDTTVAAALAADPTVKIGGPAVSLFSGVHIEAFLKHEAGLGAAGRVDFISWHEYGQEPEALAAHIRKARELAAVWPGRAPELMVTEFNVLQGGPGDTSANHYTDRVEGAIALLRSIESMQRERLDRAFLFELKDGEGPARYWGRWGILTYDGEPKPVYHVLKEFAGRPAGALPVTLRVGAADGTLGVMAYGSPARATIFVWYTGQTPARVKVRLPASFDGVQLGATLFDKTHNNPAATGDATLQAWQTLDAGDVRLDLQPNSLVVLGTP